jgi:cytosine/adenosine deaminase-related metal-dependent hydrolase
MRLAHALHSGFGFDETWSRADFLSSVIATGRKATGAPGAGRLAVGEAADFVTLDLDVLDRDAIMPVDPLDIVFARGTARHISEVIVAGRAIVADGQLTGIDLDAVHIELRARFRANLPKFAGLLEAWPQYAPAVRTWMTERCGCC